MRLFLFISSLKFLLVCELLLLLLLLFDFCKSGRRERVSEWVLEKIAYTRIIVVCASVYCVRGETDVCAFFLGNRWLLFGCWYLWIWKKKNIKKWKKSISWHKKHKKSVHCLILSFDEYKFFHRCTYISSPFPSPPPHSPPLMLVVWILNGWWSVFIFKVFAPTFWGKGVYLPMPSLSDLRFPRKFSHPLVI